MEWIIAALGAIAVLALVIAIFWRPDEEPSSAEMVTARLGRLRRDVGVRMHEGGAAVDED